MCNILYSFIIGLGPISYFTHYILLIYLLCIILYEYSPIKLYITALVTLSALYTLYR